MDFQFTEQHQMIIETAARLFDPASMLPMRRASRDGYSSKLWREVVDAGIADMRLPDPAGGTGFALMEAALVCEAAGRGLAPVPLPDIIVARRLCARVGTELVDRPRTLSPVAGLDYLDLEGDLLFLIDRDGKKRQVASDGARPKLYAAALTERNLLRAAWITGAGIQAVEMAAAYGGEREQFGKPIGAFQGVAFPLADSITDLEGARLLVQHAIWSIANERDDASSLVAMADWWARTASRVAATRALRTFGGYGLSLEFDIHLYFNAINAAAMDDGDPDLALQTIAKRRWLDETVPLPEAGDPGIETGLGDAAEKYGRTVEAFFQANMTPELQARAHHSTDGHDPAFHRALAEAGYAYPDWPEKWGGQERTAAEVTALGRVFEQFGWTRVPIGITNMGGRMVMQFGSAELQAEVLPRLASGASLSCLGFTEPESGSDMYALRTRATRVGDDWVISGQKMFTTGAHLCDYVLMIARTDPDKPKHRGISVFFFPMDLPGVSIQPVHTLQDERTNITFYDDVRVPDRYRLGEVDGGLAVMAAAMQMEHGGEGYHIHHRTLVEAMEEWLFSGNGETSRPVDDPHLRSRAARIATHCTVADLLCRKATWAAETGKGERATGSMAKLFATEAYMHDAADLVALTAPASLDGATSALRTIESCHRQSISQTIYGGTSEVHRTIIAEHGLGMPRSS